LRRPTSYVALTAVVAALWLLAPAIAHAFTTLMNSGMWFA
jgi:hypothetical protein